MPFERKRSALQLSERERQELERIQGVRTDSSRDYKYKRHGTISESTETISRSF
jgi:hypothetical protein